MILDPLRHILSYQARGALAVEPCYLYIFTDSWETKPVFKASQHMFITY